MIFDTEILKKKAVDFFMNLYSKDNKDIMKFNLIDRFPKVAVEELHACSKPFDTDEIKEALFSMGLLKAPGPDGINPSFIQSKWETIKESIHKVIRAKYNCGNGNLPIIRQRKGLEWQTGNGKDIDFWLDKWVPSCGALIENTIATPNANHMKEVANHVYASGDWKWARFEHMFPEAVCRKIAGLLPPNVNGQSDYPAWGLSKDGSFSIKCGQSCDDLLHVLRDCLRVKNIWLRLVKQHHWPMFFNLNSKNLGHRGTKWSLVFGVTCWQEPRRVQYYEKAELWGILSGLQIAWSKGYARALVETDSAMTKKMIEQQMEEAHPCAGLVYESAPVEITRILYEDMHDRGIASTCVE
ncbi:putative ribonuclease H protein At1g65750 family [Senna tora]|uniref:Putative ribonuclease H protein At1g65750 family n=1 Tax=Senna tora TaxID=362788 RepID=A0A835CA12_9FABA|nr:putative ribonuclease H protein At1g65750 family [Senna tora]